MTQLIAQNIYAGIRYIVVKLDDGTIYIGLLEGWTTRLLNRGANLSLLDEIGNQDPEAVMAALLESTIPKET